MIHTVYYEYIFSHCARIFVAMLPMLHININSTALLRLEFQVNRFSISVSVLRNVSGLFSLNRTQATDVVACVLIMQGGDRGNSLHINRQQQTKVNNKLHRKPIIKLGGVFFPYECGINYTEQESECRV